MSVFFYVKMCSKPCRHHAVCVGEKECLSLRILAFLNAELR